MNCDQGFLNELIFNLSLLSDGHGLNWPYDDIINLTYEDALWFNKRLNKYIERINKQNRV